MTTAFAVVFPFFFLGDPSGHDFEFHMNSWMEIVSHWKHGVVYPAWAGLAHYGFGEARFIFYPPFSWTLGGILGVVLPWRMVPGTYIWIGLTLSGCSMFLLARNWMPRGNAMFAAGLYAANPYHLVIVYWRSAYAELLVAALLPLLLMFVLRFLETSSNIRLELPTEAEPGHRYFSKIVIPLAFIVAAAWLTDVPAAVMVNYSLALLVAVLAVRARSPRIIAHGVLAVALGAALAAFYLLPAIYEQHWVNIGQVLSPGVRPTDNFLFTRMPDPDHNRFNLVISLVAVSEMIVLAFAMVRARRKILSPLFWESLAWWSAVSALLMFSFTSIGWKYLPELKFVQLPWRWLLCLDVALAVFVTIAWRHWASRLLLCALLLHTLVFAWDHIQPPWWDSAPDIAEMLDNQQTGQGYEGTDEYVPAGADASEIAQDVPLATAMDSSTVQIHIQQWNAESKMLTANAAGHPTSILLRLFNYPAWEVRVNGDVSLTGTKEITGQMIIPVQAGMNTIKITFRKTWDRSLGALISFLTLLLIIAMAWRNRYRERHAPPAV